MIDSTASACLKLRTTTRGAGRREASLLFQRFLTGAYVGLRINSILHVHSAERLVWYPLSAFNTPSKLAHFSLLE